MDSSQFHCGQVLDSLWTAVSFHCGQLLVSVWTAVKLIVDTCQFHYGQLLVSFWTGVSLTGQMLNLFCTAVSFTADSS